MNYADDPAIAGSLSFNLVSKSLRKDSRSVHNRLCSIKSDSEFVLAVAKAYDLPLVANERCGRWYIPPKLITDSVYFKSTDGHTDNWGFSLRRLNLHIIDLIKSRSGIIIVDSTRRGKRMPDSLSKTIPIWCAVLNRAVFGSPGDDGRARAAPAGNGAKSVHVPPLAVSSSERDQIAARVEGWTCEFLKCGIDIARLRSQIDKPLRPIWVYPDDSLILPPQKPEYKDFYPIVLCTASRMVLDGAERQSYTYVQGAADDHEAWASVITPDVFWTNEDVLLNASDAEVEHLIEQKSLKGLQPSSSIPTNVLETSPIAQTGVFIGHKTGLLESYDEVDETFRYIVDLSTSPTKMPAPASADSARFVFQHPVPDGKRGSKIFRTVLPSILSFLTSSDKTFAVSGSGAKLLVLCDPGQDFSVGAAMALLSLFYGEDGVVNDQSKMTSARIDKEHVRRRLTYIILHNRVNPSRATLVSVNSVLMGWD
ncbi:tRNA A64-2'-O-ribosylphosphate transferase [Myxozyma melibiosi]|uniref:tRNA A64-2'-O-ribosylphosphate transferase n=1 Tax=Myxozyma melibiosi TaxID=54550 RepID=A0ABR1FAV7_9ASCO